MSITTEHPRRIEPLDTILTEEEAIAFLKLDGKRALRTLREKYGLTGKRLGRKFHYHRDQLVAAAERMFGVGGKSVVGSRSRKAG